MSIPQSLILLALLGLLACNSPSLSSDPAVIDQGEALFSLNCSSCHTLHQPGIGPKLAGIPTEVSTEWLTTFIQDPVAAIASGDTRAVALAERYPQPMPGFAHLPTDEIHAILSYLNSVAPIAATEPPTTLGTPVAHPQPDSVTNSDIVLEIEPWAKLPPASPENDIARITLMREGPGEGYYLLDLRGLMYHLDTTGRHQLYFDLASQLPDFISKPGLATGFGGFAFHPDFLENGLLYTTHTEKPDAVPADFAYADSLPVLMQWVLSEWKTASPTALTFQGTRRELLRINMLTGVHGVQEIAFRSTAKPGDPDRNWLYVGVGEGGAALKGQVNLPGKPTSIWGSVIRIDPAGTNSANGQYGIPADNPFASATGPEIVRELWNYGFRNPHRYSWDEGGTGQMLIVDIGQDQIEEINVGIAGADYGWPRREGPFLLDPIADIAHVYPLPANDASLGLTYPFAYFDHDGCRAIAGGQVYRGSRFPLLQGHYLTGDIPSGKIFRFDYDARAAGKPSPIQSLQVRYQGKIVTLRKLLGDKRVDLHFAFDAAGHIFLLTKGNGTVWRVKSVSQNPT